MGIFYSEIIPRQLLQHRFPSFTKSLHVPATIVQEYLQTHFHVIQGERKVSEERDLLQRASLFDHQALAQIYDAYSPGIYRYAMRLLGDECLAEDCVAETFSRFLNSLQKKQGPHDQLQAYLYRIAHNWVVDHYRSGRETIELDASFRSEADVPEKEAAKRIRQRQVREAIQQLSPDQQKVVALKFLEDWSNEEVANVLHKPVGAVKSIQHRALESLRKLLAEKELTI